MDEEIERLVVSVRADTAGFARDVASMRGELEGPLVSGAGRAGRLIDNALARAITTGKVGFDDLKKVALSAMAEIAPGIAARALQFARWRRTWGGPDQWSVEPRWIAARLTW